MSETYRYGESMVPVAVASFLHRHGWSAIQAYRQVHFEPHQTPSTETIELWAKDGGANEVSWTEAVATELTLQAIIRETQEDDGK